VLLARDRQKPFQRLALAGYPSLHSYSRCWIHLIWGTLNREKLLNKDAAERASQFLIEHSQEKQMYMKINYVNSDHVHVLIDLPTAFRSKMWRNYLREVPRTGSTPTTSSKESSHGAGATALSPCPNQMSIKSPCTSRAKRSIIVCVVSLTNLGNLPSDMGCIQTRKAVETANPPHQAECHRPEGRC
jgi:Transposase IS200 like